MDPFLARLRKSYSSVDQPEEGDTSNSTILAWMLLKGWVETAMQQIKLPFSSETMWDALMLVLPDPRAGYLLSSQSRVLALRMPTLQYLCHYFHRVIETDNVDVMQQSISLWLHSMNERREAELPTDEPESHLMSILQMRDIRKEDLLDLAKDARSWKIYLHLGETLGGLGSLDLALPEIREWTTPEEWADISAFALVLYALRDDLEIDDLQLSDRYYGKILTEEFTHAISRVLLQNGWRAAAPQLFVPWSQIPFSKETASSFAINAARYLVRHPSHEWIADNFLVNDEVISSFVAWASLRKDDNLIKTICERLLPTNGASSPSECRDALIARYPPTPLLVAAVIRYHPDTAELFDLLLPIPGACGIVFRAPIPTEFSACELSSVFEFICAFMEPVQIRHAWRSLDRPDPSLHSVCLSYLMQRGFLEELDMLLRDGVNWDSKRHPLENLKLAPSDSPELLQCLQVFIRSCPADLKRAALATAIRAAQSKLIELLFDHFPEDLEDQIMHAIRTLSSRVLSRMNLKLLLRFLEIAPPEALLSHQEDLLHDLIDCADFKKSAYASSIVDLLPKELFFTRHRIYRCIPFIRWMRNDSKASLELLLRRYGTEQVAGATDSWTAIHYACQDNQVARLDLLLKYAPHDLVDDNELLIVLSSKNLIEHFELYYLLYCRRMVTLSELERMHSPEEVDYFVDKCENANLDASEER